MSTGGCAECRRGRVGGCAAWACMRRCMCGVRRVVFFFELLVLIFSNNFFSFQ